MGQERVEATPRQNGFWRSLPVPALLFFFLSTVFLVTSEISCVKDLWLLLKTHAQPHRVRYTLPVLIFLPWGYCVRGLWAAKSAARESTDRNISQVMVSLAVIPFWSYILFSVADDFFVKVLGLR